MTAIELRNKLNKIIKNGRGDKEVLVMQIDGGVPYAQSIFDCEAMKKYDGDDVWILPNEETIQPKWISEGKHL